MEHSTVYMGHSIIGQKTSCNKFKKSEIISSIYSYHNALKLGINHNKKNPQHTEGKENATKQPMGHWRNQTENLKIPRDK